MNLYLLLYEFPLLGAGDDPITITLEKCATEKCIMMPVSVSTVSQFSIIMEPLTDHDDRIELVDVKKNVSLINNYGLSSYHFVYACQLAESLTQCQLLDLKCHH